MITRIMVVNILFMVFICIPSNKIAIEKIQTDDYDHIKTTANTELIDFRVYHSH